MWLDEQLCLAFSAKVWKADVAQIAYEADCPSTAPVPRPVWKGEPRSSTLLRGLAFHTLAEMENPGRSGKDPGAVEFCGAGDGGEFRKVGGGYAATRHYDDPW